MTYKTAVAGLPLGGGKGVIALQPGKPPDAKRARAPRCWTSARSSSGSAAATSPPRTSALDARHDRHRQGTGHVSGLSRRAAARATRARSPPSASRRRSRRPVERAFGSASLRGRTIAVVGLGHVGAARRHAAAKAGARLVVADIDPAEARRGRAPRRALDDARQAMTAAVDVLVPCALGGVSDHEIVPRLQTPAIAGAANNQLADRRRRRPAARARRSSGHRTSSSTRAASSTSPSSCARGL